MADIEYMPLIPLPLSLLEITFSCQVLSFFVLPAETCRFWLANSPLVVLLASWPLKLFLQAVCGKYDYKINNFASLVDGKAIWCLLDYYFRKELSCSHSPKVRHILQFLLVYKFFLMFYCHFIFFHRILMKVEEKNHLCQLLIIQIQSTISYYHRSWQHYCGIFLR